MSQSARSLLVGITKPQSLIESTKIMGSTRLVHINQLLHFVLIYRSLCFLYVFICLHRSFKMMIATNKQTLQRQWFAYMCIE